MQTVYRLKGKRVYSRIQVARKRVYSSIYRLKGKKSLQQDIL